MLTWGWQDFAGASMALAGPYDLCVRQDGAGYQWWVSGTPGFYRLKQGRAGTLAGAKAAAEAAYVDYVARRPRPSLTPSEAAALLAAQASDLPPSLSPSETSR
jgi:hypothetical protein